MISECVCAPAVLPRLCGGCRWGTIFVSTGVLQVVV
ncbi:hypothetical protein [Propionibacterium phage TCUCAP1]|nr:hypothetical protein [Propionibacterium phage TCUCAP1]